MYDVEMISAISVGMWGVSDSWTEQKRNYTFSFHAYIFGDCNIRIPSNFILYIRISNVTVLFGQSIS